jgi:hypothetical protein
VKSAPSAAKTAAPRGPAEKETPTAGDDDPFAVDQSATAGAIPVNRQQGPGKTLEVTCPMCETHGFVSPKAAGKLVKCCNPQCLVPVFSAPAVKKEQPAAAPPPPKKKLPWLYIVGGMVAAGIAAVCIVVMNQTGPSELPPLPTNATGGKVAVQNGEGDGVAKPEAGNHAGGNKVAADGAAANDKEGQIRRDALERLAELSPKIPNVQKSLYRRLIATACIAAGDLKQANVHLDLLEKRGSPSPYEGVLPLAALAWQQATSSPDEFKKTLEHVRILAEKLPRRGRFATEAAVAAGALLAANGKSDESRKLLAEHRSEKGSEQVDQFAAALQVVIDDKTFNLDATLPGRTVGPWQAPLEAAILLILIHHGRWDDAISWAGQSTSPDVTAELKTIWAESYLRLAVPAGDSAGLERAKKAAEGLEPGGEARLLARLAAVKLAAGERTAAEELLESAKVRLAATTELPHVAVQGAKPLLDLKLPNATPYTQAAVAAAEIAGVQTQLGLPDAAWKNILFSLQLLHGIAPSTSWKRERAAQLERESNKIKDELKRVMGLKKDDDVRRAFSQYREKFADVAKASDVRAYWQEVILGAAVEFGLLEQVWDELQVLDRKTSIHEREPLLETGLPLFVASRFAAAGNSKRETEILKAVENRSDQSDPQVIRQISERLLRAGDDGAAIERLNEGMNSSGVLHEETLRLACRLVAAGKAAAAVTFCAAIKDTTLRQDGMFLTGALAARREQGAEVWKEASSLAFVENAAASAGLVVGLTARPAEKSVPEN